MIAAVLCIIMIALASCGGGHSAENSGETAGAASNEATENEGKNVYYAGPLFCQGERDYNLKIVKVLEENGYTVFLPQRDGIDPSELEGKSDEEKADIIFKKDVEEIGKADIIFMNLDGRVPDEGACVELGIAYADGKRCYGIKTDSRAAELGLELNPMISECFTELFSNGDGDAVIKELQEYLSENDL